MAVVEKILPSNTWDDRGLPEWGTGIDGRRVLLDPNDDQLRHDFEVWAEAACKHIEQIVLGWKNAGGAVCYKEMCQHCGLALSNMIPHAAIRGRTIVSEARETYEAKADRYRHNRAAAYEVLSDAAAARMQPDRRADYSTYLSSPEWRRKREAVLKRDNGLCQGCLTREATDVHHRTYKRLQSEFAFDLISLCRPCHDRLHAR